MKLFTHGTDLQRAAIRIHQTGWLKSVDKSSLLTGITSVLRNGKTVHLGMDANMFYLISQQWLLSYANGEVTDPTHTVLTRTAEILRDIRVLIDQDGTYMEAILENLKCHFCLNETTCNYNPIVLCEKCKYAIFFACICLISS